MKTETLNERAERYISTECIGRKEWTELVREFDWENRLYREAAGELSSVTQRLAEAESLLREWKRTSLDPFDGDEHTDWCNQFERRIDALLSGAPVESGDARKAIVGECATVAALTPEPTGTREEVIEECANAAHSPLYHYYEWNAMNRDAQDWAHETKLRAVKAVLALAEQKAEGGV